MRPRLRRNYTLTRGIHACEANGYHCSGVKAEGYYCSEVKAEVITAVGVKAKGYYCSGGKSEGLVQQWW